MITLWLIKLPPPAAVGESDGRGEMPGELPAGNLFGAEPQDVRRGLLAVEDAELPRAELAQQRHQRHF